MDLRIMLIFGWIGFAILSAVSFFAAGWGTGMSMTLLAFVSFVLLKGSWRRQVWGFVRMWPAKSGPVAVWLVQHYFKMIRWVTTTIGKMIAENPVPAWLLGSVVATLVTISRGELTLTLLGMVSAIAAIITLVKGWGRVGDLFFGRKGVGVMLLSWSVICFTFTLPFFLEGDKWMSKDTTTSLITWSFILLFAGIGILVILGVNKAKKS